MHKFKVGLLLDSLSVKIWQYHIIDYIVKHPAFEIEIVVLNDSIPHTKDVRRYFIYKLLMRFDRKIFKAKGNLFALRSIPDFLKNKIIKVRPKQGKNTDELIESDLGTIRSHKLDIIIRFGFRILKGDILSAARFGVWSLHHGDNQVNRGGPPAFWEVVNRDHTTGVTLLQLSEDLDGGRVLGKSFSTTDTTSFHRNQTSAYWAGIELFCASLNSLSIEEGESMGTQKEISSLQRFYSQPLYRNPKNFKALKIFISFWLRRSRELFLQLISEQQWSLYYYSSPVAWETSLFRYKNLVPPKGVDWADPCVISADDSTYVFFEELVRKEKKAHISMLQLNGKGQVKSKTPVRVLSEPYHLSYPSITEMNGKLYMTVESALARKVTLYECQKFPDTWIKKKEILENIELYDPTLYQHEGLWYLFGNIKPWEGNSANQYLAIYYTEDLLNGTWKPHRLNPIYRDVRCARPAGRIQKYKERIIRPSQIGAPKYGYGIKLHEIVKLTPTEFIEIPVDEILPGWRSGLLATHTFNFDDKFLFIDAQKRRFF